MMAFFCLLHNYLIQVSYDTVLLHYFVLYVRGPTPVVDVVTDGILTLRNLTHVFFFSNILRS